MIPSFDEATLSDLVAMVREWRASRGGRAGAFIPPEQYRPQVERPIYVHNDTASAIPPCACMQVTGTEKIGQTLYLLVDQPADTDGSSGWYLFNSNAEIPANGMGVAQSSNSILAFKDSGDSTARTAGEGWGPVVGQWYVAQDDTSPFIVCGDDAVIDDGLRLVLKGGGANSTGMFKMLEDMPPGKGSKARARLYNWSYALIDTIDLYNWGDMSSGSGAGFFDNVKAGFFGGCVLDQGRWRINFGPCIDDYLCSASAGVLSGNPTDGQQGVAYAFALTASGLNDDIAASGLPTGLSVNATTGNITGTPTQNGVFELTITATSDSDDGLSTCTLTIVRYLTIAAP